MDAHNLANRTMRHLQRCRTRLSRLSQHSFPAQCSLCRDPALPAATLCGPCLNDLKQPVTRCYQCAIGLPSGTRSAHSTSLLCGQCQQFPPSYTRTLCAVDYQFPADQLILAFKHQKRLNAASALSQLLLDNIRTNYASESLPRVLVPAPNHWRQQWRRGFNQAAWIAKQLATGLQNTTPPVTVAHPLQQHRHRTSQQGLSRRERLKNLKGCYRCHMPATIDGKHVALVDDVMTTGATAQHLSEILKQAGALRVDIWCLARTPSSGSPTASR